MTPEAQAEALADLDGQAEFFQECIEVGREQNQSRYYMYCGFDYLNSWDTMIPLVEKQPAEIKRKLDALLELVSFSYGMPSPARIGECLLRVTDKWTK